MNFFNSLLSIGIHCIILLSRSVSKVIKPKCNPLIIYNVWGYNCSARGYFAEIPQGLDTSIEILILRKNSFDRLNENSFARYKNLIWLNLESTYYADVENPIDYNTFQPLENLQTVTVNNIGTPFNFTFNWPEKVNNISLHGNRFVEHIDVSSVRHLVWFNASGCSLRSFPKFDQFAPLKRLDLRWNPSLRNITVEHLAPFCLLEYFGLPFAFNDSYKQCDCLRLGRWLQGFNIAYEYDVPMNCLTSIPEEINCNPNFSEMLIQQRNDCLRFQRLPLFSKWFLAMVVLIVLTPFIILAFWYSERRQKKLFNEEMHDKMKTLSMIEMEEYEGDHESDHDHREMSKMK